MSYEKQMKEWADRRKRIIEMAKRKGVRAYGVVGRTFKISRQRVQQIVADHERRSNGV